MVYDGGRVEPPCVQRLTQARRDHRWARKHLNLARRLGDYEAQLLEESRWRATKKRLSLARKAHDRAKNRGNLWQSASQH